MAAVVKLVRHEDPDATDRILDALEAKTGWSGDRDAASWTCSFPDSPDVFDAERQVVDALQRVAPGWQEQGYLTFER